MLDAMDYAKDVADQISKIPRSEYFKREERSTKYLIDEQWPLATLGKILYHPNRIVMVEYLGPNSKFGYDARIRVSGDQGESEGWDEETPVEITSAYYLNAHLVREELAQTGKSFGPGKIKRTSSGQVESSCTANDIGNDHKQFIPLVIESLNKKYHMTYPQNCLIVCALFSERSPWIREWQDIVTGVRRELGDEIKYDTFLIDTFECRCFKIRKSSPTR